MASVALEATNQPEMKSVGKVVRCTPAAGAWGYCMVLLSLLLVYAVGTSLTSIFYMDVYKSLTEDITNTTTGVLSELLSEAPLVTTLNYVAYSQSVTDGASQVYL